MYSKFLIILFCFASVFLSANAQALLPIDGNSWFHPQTSSSLNQQLSNWESKKSMLRTYIHIANAGATRLTLNYKASKSDQNFKLTAFGQERNIKISKDSKSVDLGEFNVQKSGYHAIQLEKLSDGRAPVFIDYVLSGNSGWLSTLHYVKNNDDNFFYWGRRGPSVHMSYPVDKASSVVYFYNEVEVPLGSDVIGSYFMANGFAEGYFGIQVNSDKERRVLFSVWSPYSTDNPQDIPEDHKIKMLAKGKDVYTGEFGNEGSGGQSYLKYNWKAGNRYKFIIKAIPLENNYTEYTAWFFAPEDKEWRLIAKFARPKTNTYLKGLHSFLENFIPEQGNLERQVAFSNQWVIDVNGRWTELTKGKFTVDATGRKLYRLDFAGGSKEDSFFLRNCGFFSDHVQPDLIFTRRSSHEKPHVDLEKLPVK